MILRECYFGVRRFQQFQNILGLPKGTLSARLARLTDEKLLTKIQYSNKPGRNEYRLTEKGLDLYKVMLALLRFGDEELKTDDQQPVKLIHTTCNHESHPFVACPHCRQEINARDVSFRDGPGAGWEILENNSKSRRSTDPTLLERRRPSSVARALKVLGDRWSFKVVREAFFGARRFDDIQERLGIAPNILADRLSRFVEQEIFQKVKYQDNPERYEYRLTSRGKALYAPFLAMMAWGDKWLADGKPPLILTHTKCGHDFVAEVICDYCRMSVGARDMRYILSYPDPKMSES